MLAGIIGGITGAAIAGIAKKLWQMLDDYLTDIEFK
jgi:hypothetical protein